MRHVRVVVTGRVQGVGFRYHTIRSARKAGVTGWVRNSHDGGVEIQAAGDQIDAFLEDVRRGPRFAKVAQFDVTEIEQQPKYDGFEIKY